MDVRSGMRPVHPGEILRDEIEAVGVSEALNVPLQQVTMTLEGRASRRTRHCAWHATSARPRSSG